MARGKLTQGGRELGERGEQAVELGQGFEFRGTERPLAEAGLGTGEGEGVQGLEHLAGHAATASGEAFEFGALGLALPRIELREPPNDPTAFESLCLDLWKELWCDSGARKHGRRGQRQDGVDLFGRENGQLVGVQCKQKDGRLHSTLTVAELEAEVQAATRFEPKLTKFILATAAPRDATGGK